VRRGVAGSAPRPLLFFVVLFFYGRNRERKPYVGGKVVVAVMRVGVAAVDGCGGDDYGGDAEMSGGSG
jgi:hypothetical protein